VETSLASAETRPIVVQQELKTNIIEKQTWI